MEPSDFAVAPQDTVGVLPESRLRGEDHPGPDASSIVGMDHPREVLALDHEFLGGVAQDVVRLRADVRVSLEARIGMDLLRPWDRERPLERITLAPFGGFEARFRLFILGHVEQDALERPRPPERVPLEHLSRIQEPDDRSVRTDQPIPERPGVSGPLDAIHVSSDAFSVIRMHHPVPGRLLEPIAHRVPELGDLGADVRHPRCGGDGVVVIDQFERVHDDRTSLGQRAEADLRRFRLRLGVLPGGDVEHHSLEGGWISAFSPRDQGSMVQDPDHASVLREEAVLHEERFTGPSGPLQSLVHFRLIVWVDPRRSVPLIR
jgi:hypothetical protein